MKKTNWFKKILSFILAIVMVAGMIHMPAKAEEVVYTDAKIESFYATGNPWFEPTLTDGNWRVYIKTSVALPAGGTGSYEFVMSNGTQEARVSFYADTTSQVMYSVAIPQTLVDGCKAQTITIKKGQYQSGTTGYGINLTEDFVFYVNGYSWSPVKANVTPTMEQKVTLTLNMNPNGSISTGGGTDGFYVKANIPDGAYIDTNWNQDNMKALSSATDGSVFHEGGVWKGETKSGYTLEKYAEQLYYVSVGTAEENVAYTVKGLFQDKDGRIVGYLPITVTWDGTTWTQTDLGVLEEYESTLTEKDASWHNPGKDTIQLKGTDSYLSGVGSNMWVDSYTILTPDSESGIFLGDNIATGATLRKYNGNDGLYYVENLSGVVDGSIVTIRGTFYTADGKTKITYPQAKFVFSSTTNGWSDWTMPVYSGTLTKAGAEGDGEYDSANWFTLLGTDSYAPKKDGSANILMADADDDNSGIFVGSASELGTKQTNGKINKYYAQSNYYNVESISAATEYTVITIKGTFYSQDGLAAVTFAEAKFQWDGSKWSDCAEGTAETDYTGTLKIEGTGLESAWNNQMYLKGTDLFHSDDPESTENWGETDKDRRMFALPTDEDSGFFLGAEDNLSGTKIPEGRLIKLDGYRNLYWADNFGEAQDGDILTIKGIFYTEDQNTSIKFEESMFQYKDGKWQDYIVIPKYDTVLTIEGAQDVNTQLNAISLKGTDTYLSDRGEDWSSEDTILSADIEDENSGIFIGNIKQDNAKLIKYLGTNNWYWANGFAAQAGDVVTIKGTFYSQDGGATVIVTESKFAYIGGKWIDYAGSTDTKLTSLMVDSKDYYPTFQEDRNLWYAYFKTDVTLLGTSWKDGETYTMKLSDGTSKCDVVAKKAGDNVLFVEIPANILPEGASKALTIRAGEYVNQGSNFGIRITEDFTFYVNQYGWSADESKITSALEQPVVFSLSTGGNANGFYLTANIDDGAVVNAENWGAAIMNPLQTADGAYYTGGVWRGDTQTNVYLMKIGQTSYYVALSDVGQSATTIGETYTVKGLFKDPNGRVIGYQPITVKWNGSSWEQVYTSLVDTGVQHDVNSDMNVDSRDLVRMLRHIDDSTVPVSDSQKDINCSGTFDKYDINSFKKVLLGMISYVDGKVYGTPVYNSKKVIEKMAYVCPAVGTWNTENTEFTPLSNAELDSILQKYKAAGLTLLNTENVAPYHDNDWNAEVNEPIRVYLEAAKRNDLGVLVFDNVIQYMLTQKNPAVYGANWQSVIESHIQTLQNYSSFRGFVIWDEMTIEYVDTYNQIVSYIRESHPELLLVTSLLPVTVYDQTGDDKGVGALTTNASASKEEAYRDYIWSYAEKTGHFIYDLYPLVYSENKIFGYTYKSQYGVVDDWYLNLQCVANEVKEHNYSFTTGITIQACKLTGWSNNTSSYETYAPEKPEDIGFQVYTAMAYGMKNINYFTYADHWTDTVVDGGMTEYPKVYNAVSAVNAEIDKFANVYQSFSWKDTLDLAAGGDAKRTELSTRLTSAKATGARAFVGCMKDTDGFDGYMIANADGPRVGVASQVTLTFDDATSAIVYTDGVPKTVTLTGGVCEVTVPSGEGVFVIPLRAR